MKHIHLGSGRRVAIEDDDGLILFTPFDLRTGEMLPMRGRASTLALAKEQEHLGDGPLEAFSYVLGHWDHRYWRVVDGEPASKRRLRGQG